MKRRNGSSIIIKVIIFQGIFLSATIGSLMCSKWYDMNNWFVRPMSSLEMMMNAIMIGILALIVSIILYVIGCWFFKSKRKRNKK